MSTKEGCERPEACFWIVGIMLDSDICQLVDCYTQVLKPRKPLKPIREPLIISLDTEFDKEGLISLCLAWQDPYGKVFSKLIYSEKPTIEVEELLETILDFCREYEIPLQKTIYLVSHFAQSELQHIPDLWKKLKIRVFHKSMYAEYNPYECSGQTGYKGHVLKILDSYAHFLCGLGKVAKSVGMEKVSLEGLNNQPESFWKQNMRLLMEQHRDVFESYAKQDSEILIRAFNQRRRFFLENFNLDILRCVTLAQTSNQVFSTKFLKEPVEPIKFEWTSFNRRVKSGWRSGWRKTWVYDGSKDKRYFAMKCYLGGRREAFVRGLINSPVEIWDVKQMYPTMAKLPLPNKNTEWFYLQGGDNLKSIVDGIGYVYCKFSFPEETDIPCLPVFDSRIPKLVFPLEGETWTTTYELKLALKLVCKIQEAKAWVFYPTETEKNHPLRSFMEYFTKLKNQNPEGSMPYETSKLLMNALIGKFCQRDPEYSIETYQNVLASLGFDYNQFQQVMKHFESRQKFKNPINVGSAWSPEWSSLILGSSRATISEIMAQSQAITGHTDSVIVYKGSKTECEATKLLRVYGSDLEHKKQYDSEQFWICRSAVYSPLRNGATIKPTHHGYPVDKREDFGRIIEANLKAQKPIINECYKTHLTTPRESLKQGTSLGSQTTKTTKITWEWDYKRRLLNSNVNLWSGHSETKPWKNINEILQALNKLQPENQKWKNNKPKGRQSILTKEKQTQIVKLRQEGLSIRQISQTLNLPKTSVHRFLKAVPTVPLCTNNIHIYGTAKPKCSF